MPDDLRQAAHQSLENRLQAVERTLLDIHSSLGQLQGRVLSAAAFGSIVAGFAVYFVK